MISLLLSAAALLAPLDSRLVPGARPQAARTAVPMCASESFDRKDSYAVPELLARLSENTRLPGVYAIDDASGVTQFVGTSRNVALSLRAHLATMPEKVSTVRVQSFASADRQAMEAAKRGWIKELGATPDGNGANSQPWADAVREAVFSPIASVAPRTLAAAMSEPPVISPFEAAEAAATAAASAASGLTFTVENVNAVLEEVTKIGLV